ncbi:hypothetical protein [Kitasatospora sp. MBT66]|uniref:hypothetical protein n=1 Tax=Kitasatospora sp. MBT66 TaxID=1444769 RepID=UPI0005BB642F|nr:hypothetical protein [Kitasatospora sp. MBT66]
MSYLALRGAQQSFPAPPVTVLPFHSYSVTDGLNVTADGVPLVEAATVRGFSITNKPFGGTKKDDEG